MKLFISIVFCLFSLTLSAQNAWYWGNVTQIITIEDDGSFLVYVDNATLKSTCRHQRVSFKVSDMGAERTKAALSMALTAFSSGKRYGVVVDLPADNEVCSVPASASQGAGIRN